jgi:hypothetical protein
MPHGDDSEPLPPAGAVGKEKSSISADAPISREQDITRTTSRGSRFGEALKSVRSVEVHPPLHAHFDAPPSPPLVENEKSVSGRSDGDSRDAPVLKHHGGRVSEEDEGEGEGGGVQRPVLDIEHMPCDDDPREWPRRKKNWVLGLMTVAVVRRFCRIRIPWLDARASLAAESRRCRSQNVCTDDRSGHWSRPVYTTPSSTTSRLI